MIDFAVIQFERTAVGRVKADAGTRGAGAAMRQLESRMQSLRGRKMYGVYYPAGNDYDACVKLDAEHPDDMGFERGTIPGGRYARVKMRDWPARLYELGRLFEELQQACSATGNELDLERPHIEFYRSLDELLIMVPVK